MRVMSGAFDAFWLLSHRLPHKTHVIAEPQSAAHDTCIALHVIVCVVQFMSLVQRTRIISIDHQRIHFLLTSLAIIVARSVFTYSRALAGGTGIAFQDKAARIRWIVGRQAWRIVVVTGVTVVSAGRVEFACFLWFQCGCVANPAG